MTATPTQATAEAAERMATELRRLEDVARGHEFHALAYLIGLAVNEADETRAEALRTHIAPRVRQ